MLRIDGNVCADREGVSGGRGWNAARFARREFVGSIDRDGWVDRIFVWIVPGVRGWHLFVRVRFHCIRANSASLKQAVEVKSFLGDFRLVVVSGFKYVGR